MGALSSMLQSLRLWNRAVDAIARLAPPTRGGMKGTEENENPFEVTNDAKPDQPSSGSKPTPTPTDALSWRLLSHLVSTLFWLAHAYHVRGSPREALYFVQQAQELAESARAPAVVARACVVRGEVLLGQGALAEGRAALEMGAGMLGGVVGIDTANAQRLRGDFGVVCETETGAGGEVGGPVEHYERAWRMLDELERRIVAFDGGCVISTMNCVHGLIGASCRRRKSSLEPVPMGVVVQGGQGIVVPRLLSAILGRHSTSALWSFWRWYLFAWQFGCCETTRMMCSRTWWSD